MGQLQRCMMEVPLVLSSGQMPNCGVGTWGGFTHHAQVESPTWSGHKRRLGNFLCPDQAMT